MNIKKAFTLVELLIVAMVIGILVAIMVLSGSQATTTAKANNILNDMRHIRDAARMYFWDNPDIYNDPEKANDPPNINDLGDYIERFETKEKIYEIKPDNGQWKVEATVEDDEVREKIVLKAAKNELTVSGNRILMLIK